MPHRCERPLELGIALTGDRRAFLRQIGAAGLAATGVARHHDPHGVFHGFYGI